MSTKNKDNNKKTIQKDNRESIVSHLGLAVLSMAAVMTVTELHPAKPHQAAGQEKHDGSGLVRKLESFEQQTGESLRREKEEIRHASVSYGVTMRSHPTAGAA